MKASIVVIGLWFASLGLNCHPALPPDYKGKPFHDEVYSAGPQPIPGMVQCAYFDLGGEGVAYHDTDAINHLPASECKLPLATGSMHKWNRADIGTITFSEAGLQLLTFHYNSGNNFAQFEFTRVGER